MNNVPSFPEPSSAGMRLILQSSRNNLRQVLRHDAFTPERRRNAEQLLAATTDAALLMKWKLAALRECQRWEDRQAAA